MRRLLVIMRNREVTLSFNHNFDQFDCTVLHMYIVHVCVVLNITYVYCIIHCHMYIILYTLILCCIVDDEGMGCRSPEGTGHEIYRSEGSGETQQGNHHQVRE